MERIKTKLTEQSTQNPSEPKKKSKNSDKWTRNDNPVKTKK